MLGLFPSTEIVHGGMPRPSINTREFEMNTTQSGQSGAVDLGVVKSAASDLLSRQQAADYLGVAVHTLAIWKCTRRHDLPYVKIGRLVKYKRSELDAFISKNSAG
jgi:excisionase family DNA binding protein